ncbi:MAG: type II secretion system F family protein [Kiritimatiellae bacterium]|nr:type II secretion system F family protein [Kiritimatiellia bacterium]
MAVSFETYGRKVKSRRPRGAAERFLSRFLVGSGAIEQAFQQLVILLKGDVPVVSALETCSELSGGDLKAALREAAELVRGGMPLAKALRTSMPWIGGVFIGLVEVGEANGSLLQMFTYAARIMQQRRAIRSQVVRAMTYPVLVVLMGLGVGYYVSTVAIPKIISVMGNPDALPPVTRSLLSTSAFLRAHGAWLLLAPALAVAAWMALRRTPGVGTFLDRMSLHIPIFGKVGRFSANALFNHTMSMLVASGISVVDALELVRETLSNGWYKVQLAEVRRKVVGGRMFSDSLGETSLRRLSPLTPALVKVGESSGSMDEGLDYAGDYYSAALERRLDLLGKLVEPALIVVVGGMVAYVYIAFFMGMAAMNAAAR